MSSKQWTLTFKDNADPAQPVHTTTVTGADNDAALEAGRRYFKVAADQGADWVGKTLTLEVAAPDEFTSWDYA